MSKDRLKPLKYIGYCMANMPFDDSTTNMEDFLQYVKFQLCKINHKLLKDPVWDTYSNEELLTEYYAHSMGIKEEREKFEVELQRGNIKEENINEWILKETGKKEEEPKLEELEDISFKPEDLLEG